MGEMSIYLRKATMSDADILYEWVNDKTVRQNAFDTHTISYEEHTAWFGRMMSDPEEMQYILMHGDIPIGQARITINDNTAEIDYSISPQERGNGYGMIIIEMLKKQVEEDFPNICKLIGKVKPSNEASCSCFLRNSFDEKYKLFEYVIRG